MHGMKALNGASIECFQCGKRTSIRNFEVAMRSVEAYRKNSVVALDCGHAVVVTSKTSFFALPYTGEHKEDDWGKPIRNGL